MAIVLSMLALSGCVTPEELAEYDAKRREQFKTTTTYQGEEISFYAEGHSIGYRGYLISIEINGTTVIKGEARDSFWTPGVMNTLTGSWKGKKVSAEPRIGWADFTNLDTRVILPITIDGEEVATLWLTSLWGPRHKDADADLVLREF
ncbi:hypothetical protein RXV90_25550 [Rhodophyticola sp. MJ-SS7]|nr:hypothetical protein [Rhodophyticola sp. MJ-SS7]